MKPLTLKHKLLMMIPLLGIYYTFNYLKKGYLDVSYKSNMRIYDISAVMQAVYIVIIMNLIFYFLNIK